MTGAPSKLFFTYLIFITIFGHFTQSFEYFNDDITNVFRGMVDENPNDIQFFAYPSRSDPTQTFEITMDDTNSLLKSGLTPRLPMVFIIHGFRSNVSSEMPQILKNAFLQANLSINIIIVNWGQLSTPLPADQTAWLYYLVPPNVPVVAKRVAQFIIFLRNNNFISKFSDVYLIGHSLGAHVSGLAGREIFLQTDKKVGRITGLDPAGPLYYPSSPSKNLMKENALFVDIIHTNAGLLGSLTNDGHADFWPNGGCSQPNCELHDTSSVATLGRCSHQYAYHLYAASITMLIPSCPCKYVGFSGNLPLCNVHCNNPINLGFNCPHWVRGAYFSSTKHLPI